MNVSEAALSPAVAPTAAQAGWRRFCQAMTAIFYRRRETCGVENLPPRGPVILCANHVNALADAVVVQASCPRPIHPLARSGLFRNPLLRPLLGLIQAVPIYRRRPGQDAAAAANEDSFRRCHEYLDAGRAILIFPEGQSHSDPMLRPLKTGAARLALGFHERRGVLPAVVPVGLTFPQKGRFRSELLVQYGKPVELETGGDDREAAVRRATDAILEGLRRVTLNVESWQDLELMRLLQRFFLLRGGRHEGARGSRPGRKLSERFQSLQRLIEAHRWLRLTRPDEVSVFREKLRRFERLCRRYGVDDYHLHLRYRPALVARFVSRSLVFALFVFPLALWGLLWSSVPYLATRWMTRLTAWGRDQYDTAGMLFGLAFFFLFWGVQTFAAWWLWGLRTAALYGASLPLTAAVALVVAKERKRITENVRVFFLFVRRRQVREYLRLKRQELEIEVAHMVRLARQGA